MNTHDVRGYTPSMKLFLLVSAGVFTLLTLTLIVIDFYPEPVFTSSQPNPVIVPDSNATDEEHAMSSATQQRSVVAETPTRIVIERIGVDAAVTNPESTDVSVLDRALQSGAVRYPDSGRINESANMLIFGHSSYLPVVKNKAYQAFNELGKLVVGDEITMYAGDTAYTYTVMSVVMAKADDVTVPLTANQPMLTLSTCNTFGAKEDRWVVTAVQKL